MHDNTEKKSCVSFYFHTQKTKMKRAYLTTDAQLEHNSYPSFKYTVCDCASQ